MNPKTTGGAAGAPLRTAVALLAAVAALLLLPAAALSQGTGTVTGVVRTAGEGAPLAGVRSRRVRGPLRLRRGGVVDPP